MAGPQSSKYGALPFLDSDKRDVFETDEEVKTEGDDNGNDENDCVNILDVSHEAAYGAFQNKEVNADKLDFSDHIRSGSKTGYAAKTIYELICEENVKETPQQRLQRLKLELKELAAEVSAVKKDGKGAQDGSPVDVLKEVSELQKQLKTLNLESVLGVEGLSGDGTMPGSWTKEIKGQLQNFKSKPTSKDSTSQDCVKYEVYYKPDTAKFAATTKAVELDKRLNALEGLLGRSDNRWTPVLSQDQSNGNSLLDAVTSIQAKLSLVDTTNLELIDVRLQGVLHLVGQISSKKEVVENADKQEKLSKLSETMKKCDAIADVVPDLVDRMKSLSTLHQEGSEFAKSLVHLQSTQENIHGQLTDQKGLLQQLEKTFAENISTIQKNCESIDERVNLLLKKVDKK